MKRPLSLAWDDTQRHSLIVSLTVSAENLGHSPALNVDIQAYPKFGEGPFLNRFSHPSDQVDITRQTCSARDAAQHNVAVFPADTHEKYVSIHLPESAFDDYLRELREINDKRPDTFYSLRIILCVRYSVYGDRTVHHTGRLLHVDRQQPGQTPACCYVLEVGKNEDDIHLALNQFTTGDYAD